MNSNKQKKRIRKLEDGSFEIIESEEQKEKRMKKSEESLQDLWDTTKQINIGIMGVPEGEEREKGAENLFEEKMVKMSQIWGRTWIYTYKNLNKL